MRFYGLKTIGKTTKMSNILQLQLLGMLPRLLSLECGLPHIA